MCSYLNLDSTVHHAGCDVFEIVIMRNYNENTLKDDMKRLYNSLGVDNKKTVFLFTAAQVMFPKNDFVAISTMPHANNAY